MAKKTIKVIIDDSSELKPTPMMSIPVPYDSKSPYVGNSVFASVVFEKRNGLHYYYRARKDVPAGTPLSDTEYWEAISGLERVGIYEAFINHLFADIAFIKRLATDDAFINNLTAKRLLVKDENGSILAEFDANKRDAKIGGFEVVGTQLKGSYSYTDEMSDKLTNTALALSPSFVHFTESHNGGKAAEIIMGSNIVPDIAGGGFNLAMQINQNIPNKSDIPQVNVGLEISVEGGSKGMYGDEIKGYNHAIRIKKGNICGLRYQTRVVTSDYTLTPLDTYILVDRDGINLYLPDTAEDGQLYIVRNTRGSGYTMNGKIMKSSSSYDTSDYTSKVWEHRFVYIKAKGYWLMSGVQI